jgi:hypothetical protein
MSCRSLMAECSPLPYTESPGMSTAFPIMIQWFAEACYPLDAPYRCNLGIAASVRQMVRVCPPVDAKPLMASSADA